MRRMVVTYLGAFLGRCAGFLITDLRRFIGFIGYWILLLPDALHMGGFICFSNLRM